MIIYVFTLSPVIFYYGSIPKRPFKSSSCGPFEATDPNSCQTTFLTPKWHKKHPCPYYLRVPGSVLRSGHCCSDLILGKTLNSRSVSSPKCYTAGTTSEYMKDQLFVCLFVWLFIYLFLKKAFKITIEIYVRSLHDGWGFVSPRSSVLTLTGTHDY